MLVVGCMYLYWRVFVVLGRGGHPLVCVVEVVLVLFYGIGCRPVVVVAVDDCTAFLHACQGAGTSPKRGVAGAISRVWAACLFAYIHRLNTEQSPAVWPLSTSYTVSRELGVPNALVADARCTTGLVMVRLYHHQSPNGAMPYRIKCGQLRASWSAERGAAQGRMNVAPCTCPSFKSADSPVLPWWLVVGRPRAWHARWGALAALCHWQTVSPSCQVSAYTQRLPESSSLHAWPSSASSSMPASQ